MAQSWVNYPIGHGYLTQYQGPGTDTPHYADDVETPFHTPISALLSGTVKQADYAVWSGQPGGGEVFIQPDAGGPEYYFYHLDELDVHQGQHLSAGQQVGLSGGQNSGGMHNVSPMWSSGPHTHVGYFTNYTNTPAGSRPYGPDITSLLKSAQNPGGIGAQLYTAGLQQANPGGSSSSSSSCWGVTIAGQCVGIPQPSPVTLYRVAFVVIGLVLIWLGLKHFLNKQDITINLPGKTATVQEGEAQG